MTTPEALNELADRVEREEPSEALNDAIGRALGLNPKRVFHGGIEADEYWPAYATSLDAAVTLMPEGDSVFWRLGHDGMGPDPAVFRAEVLVCLPGVPGRVGRALTPAAALTSAALRARAADMQARAEDGAPHPSRTA